MSHPEEYDVVVLGSGRARFFAWSLASQGKRVAVVERRNLAGSCPTIACAPSKNVIHGAKVANYFRRGAEFGIAAGDWKVEMPAVRDRKRKMVDGIVALNVNAYRESGAELVMGNGRFVAPKTVEVALNAGGTRTLRVAPMRSSGCPQHRFHSPASARSPTTSRRYSRATPR